MKISELAVKNYQFTIVLFLLLVSLGVYSYLKIPQAEDPEFPLAIYPIFAVYPGATPEDIEEMVIEKVEKSLNELEDIYKLTSDIREGIGIIVIEFNSMADADKKYDEIVRQINSVRSELPPDLYSIEAIKITAGNTNIVQSAIVSGNASYGQLGEQAEELRDRISELEGIRNAEAMAYPEREVSVEIDLEKMASLKITVSQVIGALQSENASIPGGSLEIGPKKFNVKTSGRYNSLNEIENTIVGAGGGKVVYLKDLAGVSWSYADLRYFGRYNGEPAAFVIASMKSGQNIHKIRKEIYKVYDNFEKSLPAGIRLERGFDQSENVKTKLGHLQRDFLFAILLVLITLMPLGLRASGIVMISIPLSVLIGVTGLYLTGFSINQLSIVGAVIALGLLVDDSIVVVENISRWVREGTPPSEASVKATRQIGMAVIGCTGTLILAFLPLMFLPGKAGLYMRSLPTTVAFIVLGSLFVALTIIPFIASKVFRQQGDPRGNVILRGFNRAIDFTYGRALQASLRHPLTTVLIAGSIFFASLFIIKIIGFSLFPKAGLPQFLITVETPRGSNINETDKAVRFAESVLSEYPWVRYYMSNTGKGNPMIFYNSFQKSEQSTTGEILVEIDRERVPEIGMIVDKLRDTLSAYVNGRFYVNEFENGAPVDAPIALRLVGENLDTLTRYSKILENIFLAHEGTTYVTNPLNQSLTDIKVSINTVKSGIFGVPTVEIDRTIRLALAGLDAGRYRDREGKEYDISVKLQSGENEGLQIFDKIYVASLNGNQVPLSQLATVGFSDSPVYIEHYSSKRSVTVACGVKSGYNTDKVTKEILQKVKKIELPGGFTIVEAGEIESRKESFAGIGTAIIVAVFGIFLILILEFKTFRSTLIVLSVIPLGIIGGLLFLWFTGYSLSFAAAIGFVALIGIEIKNSILLVDFTNQIRQQGTPLDEAILKAGEIRFLPVLLTTLTAIGGLMPIAISHSNLYSPLAWVIIGGLITSTLLARLVTPVMYKLIPPEIFPEEKRG